MTLFSRLAAYYPCDNTHGRSLSEDVVGTNNGTAGVVSAAPGKVRQGMFFLLSGGQFRSVPNDSALQALKGVCCWVKFSTLAADMSIVSKGSDGTDANTSIKLWYDHSDTDLAFTVGDGSTSTTVRTDGITLAVDTWYHVRCFNDGNRMGIAVNGTLYGSGTARAPLTETGLLYLGSDFSNNYFDGVLDEVALFSTAPTIADGATLYSGGTGTTLPVLDNLTGPTGRAGAGSRFNSPSFAESNESVVYMAHGKMPVQRFDGTLARAGVESPTQKVTLKSSGSGSLTGRRYAYLRFLDASGQVSSVSPLSDVHDTFGTAGSAITGATNASPIVITSASHGLTTGQTVRVTGQLGNTAANGTWKVNVQSVDTFALEGSVGNGDWAASEAPAMQVTVQRAGSSGTSQVQTLSYSNAPTAGSFTLSFRGDTTTTLTYDDTAADIQAALEALPSIGEDNVVCAGGALPTSVTVTFAEALANQDLPLLVVAFTGAPSTLSATETTKGTTGQNETQTIDLLNSPTGGTFTVTFDGQTTGNIAYNANAATVEAALEALSNITSGDLTTTGGALPGTAVTVEFGGTLATTNVAQMTINPANLTSGPSIAISTPTPGVAGNDEWQVINPTNGTAVAAVNNISGNASVSAGTFTISTDFVTTAAIAYDATYLEILQALWLAGEDYEFITGNGDTKINTASSIPFTHGGSNAVTTDAAWTIDSSGLTGGTYTNVQTTAGSGTWANLVGTYRLTFDGQETSGLNVTQSASVVQSALEALSTIGTGNVLVTGGNVAQQPLFIRFTGDLAGTDVGGVTVTNDNITSPASGGFTGQPVVMQAGASGSSTNETQRITTTGTPSEGTFTLTYDGQTTSDLDYDSTAAEVDTALEALSNIDAGDVTCTGGPLPGTAIDVEFTGNLAGINVSEMTATPSSAPSMTTGTTTPGVASTTFDLANAADDSVTNASVGTGAWTTDGKGYFSISGRSATFYKASTAWDQSTFNAGNVVSNNNLISGSFALASYACISGDGDTVYILFTTITTSDRYWPNALLTFTHNYAPSTGNCTYLQADGNEVINGGFAQCTGICVGNSESTLYFTTTHLDRIVQWDMSTPGDVTTGGRVASDDIDVSGETTTPAGITLNSDGTKIYIGDSGSTTIYQYDLTTGFDGSTASYSSVSYDCGLTVRALTVEPDGTKLFISHTSGMDRHSFSSGGTDEIQRITASGSPSEGTFTLTYSGQTTSALDYDSTAAEVDTALEALSNIDAGDVTCSGGPLPGSVVDVTFTGNLAATNVDAMTVDYDGLLRLVTTTTGGINASDELVTLTTDVPPGTGTFTLTFGGQTTANLNWNATAAQVQSKLAALSTIGDGNVSCTGGPINSAAVKVKFVGTLAKQDVGAITASSSMTQTSPVMSVTITTDGNSGVNELQLITVEKVSGGTFTLNSDADTTTSLSFDATASEVQAELEALSDVGNGNVLVTGGPLTEAAFNVEFIGSLGNTDVSTLGTGTASLLNGGWASGANKITYTDVEIPDSTSVTRRQILRTKPGDANVFYIDIDEADVISNTFSSTNTDDDLKSDVAVVMIDSNGVDTNLSRHGVPPNYKRVVTSYQNRLFYGVDYVERSMVTISGDTATGVATDWPGVFDSRTLYDDTGKAIVDVDANQQTATLSESTTTEQDALRATIRQGGDDSQRIYHSALTAIEALPESVHPNQSFLISRSDRDGDMAGQFNFDGQNYVAFQSAIYRYSYSVDPASAPDGDGRMQLIIPRGVCNNRTVAFTDDLAFCVDREGAYLLDGDTLESVSGPIKPMFSGRGGTRINWKHQDNFHAAYFGTERTVRFFVTLDGGPYPRHALCWNVDQRFWWIEKFAYPIVSSTTGVLDGKSVVFLGSTGRRVFTMTGTREALGRNVPGSLRGTATSADTLSITDAAATFPSSLLGSTVTIVSGTGRGQTRRIVEVAATKLTVHEEWGAQPSDDSVYQLAAVNWSAKTGKMRFEQSNEKELRRLEMFWEPLSNASSLDYQLYLDFQSSAVNNERTLTAEDSDGIATTEGTPYNSVDLTKRGHVEQDFGGMRQEGVSGDKFLTIEVEGSTNDEQLRLLGIAVSGAE